MGRVHIAIGMALLVAGLILYVVVRGTGEDDSTETAGAKRNVNQPGTRATSPTTTPRLASGKAGEPDGGVYTDDVVGNRRVRDYRGRDIDLNPDAKLHKPLKVLKIEPQLMSSMGLKLRAVAKRCKLEHAADVPANSKVQPRVTFSISDEKLTVNETELTFTNIPEGTEFESCLRSGVVGLSIEAPDHAVVASHKMAVPIILDRL